MSATITRANVVNAARAWVGTPFHHQARERGVGVDCVGLIIGVARDLGLVAEDFDVPVYGRMPDGVSLMEAAHLHMTPVTFGNMRAGDVVVVSFDSHPQHFGILAPYQHGGHAIIHAAQKHGRVVETRLMFHTAMRFEAAFALPGVN